MHQLLQQAEFRAHVLAYIRANLRAHVSGLETAAAIKKIPNETEIAYSHPVHPDAPDYDKQLKIFERRLA